MNFDLILGYITLVYLACLALLAWRTKRSYERGFDDGCAFVRHNVESENALRNVEPLILDRAEHRLLMEVLRSLEREDRGTIH